MRFLIALAATALALAGCAPQAEETPAEPADATEPAGSQTLDAIPEAFLGRWDITEESCGDPASDMRLDIEPNRVAFYESSAGLEAIAQQPSGALVVDHRFSGEGEEWEEQLAYELSEDGERLTVTTPDGSFSTRMRCP